MEKLADPTHLNLTKNIFTSPLRGFLLQLHLTTEFGKNSFKLYSQITHRDPPIQATDQTQK